MGNKNGLMAGKDTIRYKERALKQWSNPKFIAKQKLARLNVWKSPSEKRQRHLKVLSQSENRKQKLREFKQCKEHKEKMRKIALNNWKNPTIRANRIKWGQENVPLLRERTKQLWQDPTYVRKQIKARGVYPNKTEMKLLSILNRLYPNEWKYVGDGEFILAGKNPDFVNVNGRKIVIDLFGEYWHTKEEAVERIALFKKYGFKTVIIWGSKVNLKRVKEEVDLTLNK